MSEPLPGVLAEIAGLVGQGKALQLANEVGGTRVYIPSHASDKHWLVKAVGRDAADKICAHFSVDRKRGQRVEIPIVAGSYKQLLRTIAATVDHMDADEKASSAKIARRAGVTQRTVHRHRARRAVVSKPASKQGKLL